MLLISKYESGRKIYFTLMKKLDQFYTKPTLAAEYVRYLEQRYPLAVMDIVEPSAGAGAFSTPLIDSGYKVTAIDLQPQVIGIEQGDFLHDFTPPEGNQIAVVGNPPFGFASSLAIQFFNTAAEWASLIAFIVPRTFRKVSVHDKLDLNFWLAVDKDVPKDSFIRNGKPHDVPCAFQVWERRDVKRQVPATPDVSHLICYVDQVACDFAMRRVGGRAGAVLPPGDLSPSSNYFIQDKCGYAQKLISKIDWHPVRSQTAGVRSLSKREIAIELTKAASICKCQS